MDNYEITKILQSGLQLMELHDADSKKIRAFQNALFNLERFQEPLDGKSIAELKEISGVGPSVAQAIMDVYTTGIFPEGDEFLQKTPKGILELLQVRGIGPGKIKTIWKEKGIETPEDFLVFAKTDDLVKLKGFGQKTVDNIRDSLAFYLENKSKLLLSDGLTLSEAVVEEMNAILAPHVFEISGQVRRRSEIIDLLSFISTASEESICDSLAKIAPDWEIREIEPKLITGIIQSLYPFEIFLTSESRIGFDQLYFSTPAVHFEALKTWGLSDRRNYKDKTEDEIYRELSLHPIPPECREDEMIEHWKITNPVPDLITDSAMKGMLHCHSTYSDGRHSLREMAEACIARGYEYLGIADHSKSAFFYANGMFEGRVMEQHKEIDALNKELAPFKIFKGIESDILPEGDLDYADDILSQFDFVVASVHSVLNMDITKAMNRLMRTIQNPHTTIIGHLTGRILLERKGFPVDHQAILDACAEHQVGIEINAHPSRLDLDWRWVNYAMKKGVTISINPDAHSTDGFDMTRFGIMMGRKAGLTKEATLNTLSVSEIDAYFKKLKSSKGINS